MGPCLLVCISKNLNAEGLEAISSNLHYMHGPAEGSLP